MTPGTNARTVALTGLLAASLVACGSEGDGTPDDFADQDVQKIQLPGRARGRPGRGRQGEEARRDRGQGDEPGEFTFSDYDERVDAQAPAATEYVELSQAGS